MSKGCVRLLRVEPIGERDASGFVCRSDGRGGPTTWREKVYPPSKDADAFRKARHHAGLSIGQCGRLLGLRPSEISDIEFGRAVFATDGERESAYEWMRLAKRVDDGGR